MTRFQRAFALALQPLRASGMIPGAVPTALQGAPGGSMAEVCEVLAGVDLSDGERVCFLREAQMVFDAIQPQPIASLAPHIAKVAVDMTSKLEFAFSQDTPEVVQAWLEGFGNQNWPLMVLPNKISLLPHRGAMDRVQLSVQGLVRKDLHICTANPLFAVKNCPDLTGLTLWCPDGVDREMALDRTVQDCPNLLTIEIHEAVLTTDLAQCPNLQGLPASPAFRTSRLCLRGAFTFAFRAGDLAPRWLDDGGTIIQMDGVGSGKLVNVQRVLR